MQQRHYHLAGVGGVGMSALAEALCRSGCRVSGSDRAYDQGTHLDVLDVLQRCGVELVPQDGKQMPSATDVFVQSTAIEPDNPEVREASRRGIPVRHRSQVLAELLAGHETVAIAGTCGKSSVTAMVGWLLACAGRDPVVVNGAPVLNWSDAEHTGSVRWGDSDLRVVEADESDRSLLNYTVDWAVVTNASEDHFDLVETRELFDTFAAGVRRDVIRGDIDASVWSAFDPDCRAGECGFEYKGVAFRVPLPGRHNAENAYLAVQLCERLGCELSGMAEAFGDFRGIARRLQHVGDAGEVTVYDDYAHNPAKIRAAWCALAPHYAHVHALWRPHGYGPLRSMQDALHDLFSECVGDGDSIDLLPVYDAGGTADRSVNADRLADRLAAAGAACHFCADPADAVKTVAARCRPGDVVLVMGARDPGLPQLAADICAAVE